MYSVPTRVHKCCVIILMVNIRPDQLSLFLAASFITSTFPSQVCHIAIYGRRGGRWPVWWVFHCGKPQHSIKLSRKLWPDQSVYHKWCWSQKGTLASFCDMPRAPCQLLMFHYHQRQIIRILLTIQQLLKRVSPPGATWSISSPTFYLFSTQAATSTAGRSNYLFVYGKMICIIFFSQDQKFRTTLLHILGWRSPTCPGWSF